MRAPNMAALTNDVYAEYPGVVIYGKGDKRHEMTSSDHNEDDTPGIRTPQTDADSLREHRAIDVMLGPAFSRAQADALIQRMLAQGAIRDRLDYIIFFRRIWSRSNNWVEQPFTKDPHTDHIHFSGIAYDDANTSPWLNGGSDMQASLNDSSEDVMRLQSKLLFLAEGDPRLTGEHPLVADGNYGPRTAFWVSVILTGGLGDRVTPSWFDILDGLVRRKEIASALAAHLASAEHGGQLPDSITFTIPAQIITAELG